MMASSEANAIIDLRLPAEMFAKNLITCEHNLDLCERRILSILRIYSAKASYIKNSPLNYGSVIQKLRHILTSGIPGRITPRTPKIHWSW